MTKIKAILFLVVFATAIYFAVASKAGSQPFLVNEIEADAPDATFQFACQYVELRGEPGSVVPANYYFVSINGASASFGDLSFIVPLGGRTVGSNGTISIVNDIEGTCPNRTLPAGTTLVTVQDFDGLGLIDGGARTFAIVAAPTAPQAGDDLDTNNDRTIDPSNGISLVDGFGFTTNELFQTAYGPNLFDAATDGAPGTILLPDAASRFPTDSTPLSANAWYFGELASSPAETISYSGAPQSANFPSGGELTPGLQNAPGGIDPTPTPTQTPTPTPTPTITPTPSPTPVPSPRDAIVDFNGDGKTDFSITRSVNGVLEWWTYFIGTDGPLGVSWGSPGDIHTAEDFDGDGKDDFAVWRPNAGGDANFFVFESSTFTFRAITHGSSGDDPTVVGDWDGDNIADAAVFRENATDTYAAFYIRMSTTDSIVELPWGAVGDRAVRADFDGDSKIDAAVFRPSTGFWYVLRSSDSRFSAVQWGISSDKVVVGDFDNDGRNDHTVVRDGFWYVLRSSDLGVSYYNWGLSTDTPVAADYDGDGATDVAVWRDGTFYVYGSLGEVRFVSWGSSSDFPVASVFNR
ncbi:MAG: hypothetical protein ABL984_08555 [Pyrinomonadaceae bacterium]